MKSSKGIFRVSGVNSVAVKRLVEKSLEDYLIDMKQPTLSQYEEEFNKRYAHKFKTMKPVSLSKEFSTPELAYEYIALMSKTMDESDYRDLRVMIQVDKLDKDRSPMKNPKTGGTLKKWIYYSEFKQSKAAA